MYRMDKWMNTEICNGISYYSMSFLQQHKPSWFIIISQSLTLYVSFLCLAWFSIGVTLPETFLDRREKSLLYFYWGTIDNTTITFLSLFLWWRQPDVCMCFKYILIQPTQPIQPIPPIRHLVINFLISLNPPGYFAPNKSVNSIHVEIVFCAILQSLLIIIVCDGCMYNEDMITKQNFYSVLFCTLSDKWGVWLAFLMQKGIYNRPPKIKTEIWSLVYIINRITVQIMAFQIYLMMCSVVHFRLKFYLFSRKW